MNEFVFWSEAEADIGTEFEGFKSKRLAKCIGGGGRRPAILGAGNDVGTGNDVRSGSLSSRTQGKTLEHRQQGTHWKIN